MSHMKALNTLALAGLMVLAAIDKLHAENENMNIETNECWIDSIRLTPAE